MRRSERTSPDKDAGNSKTSGIAPSADVIPKVSLDLVEAGSAGLCGPS